MREFLDLFKNEARNFLRNKQSLLLRNKKYLVGLLVLGILILVSQGLTGTVYAATDLSNPDLADCPAQRNHPKLGSVCKWVCLGSPGDYYGREYQGQCSCEAGFAANKGKQEPSLSDRCASCIAGKKADVIGYLKGAIDNGNYKECNDKTLLNYWCNGGVGSQGTSDCNAIKNGDCSQQCGGKYTVSGKVFQADGITPASGVKVEVWNDLNPPTKAESVSDTTGRFTVNNFINSDKAYAVRIPKTQSMTITKVSTLNNTSSRQIAGQYTGENTPLGNESYEYQLTHDRDCATECNFKIEVPITGTIRGKVVNARGTGVSGVKVWIGDEAGTTNGAECGNAAACDNGKYKSVTTGSDGKFEGQVTMGSRGYWVRIPDQASLGVDGTNNIAIFTAKKATKGPFVDTNTNPQSYETQAFNTISHGCWNDCNFTVTLVPLFPTRVRVAGSATGLLLTGVYEHEFSGQYTPSNPLIIDDWSLNDVPESQRVYIQFGFGTGSNFQWDTTNTYQSEAVIYNPTSSPSPSPSTQRMPGDADDNKCVNTDDYTIWKQEVRGGRNTKCANWTTENPPIVDTEDYGIWYRAWKVLSNRENCVTPPAGRCLDQR